MGIDLKSKNLQKSYKLPSLVQFLYLLKETNYLEIVGSILKLHKQVWKMYEQLTGRRVSVSCPYILQKTSLNYLHCTEALSLAIPEPLGKIKAQTTTIDLVMIANKNQ